MLIAIYHYFITVNLIVSPKCYYTAMDFRDRLREQIDFLGLLDKEVAARAGISKRAIDSYVGSRGCMPSADIAVRIAQVLGVSVEYLITGKNDVPNEILSAVNKNENSTPMEEQKLLKTFTELSQKDKKTVIALAEYLNSSQ